MGRGKFDLVVTVASCNFKCILSFVKYFKFHLWQRMEKKSFSVFVDTEPTYLVRIVDDRCRNRWSVDSAVWSQVFFRCCARCWWTLHD